MGDQSAIEWTEATWNPWQGCHKVSPGCKHCYMYREKKQYGQNPTIVIRSKPPTFNLPLRLKGPQRVFTCSWSDFFIEEADPWRDEAWEIIRATPHLTYQILTKRPERIAGRLPWHRRLEHTAGISFITEEPWTNVWLGVSVEDQATFQKRWGILRRVPAAVRFLSMEPLLGRIDMQSELWEDLGPFIWPDWIITGGESGPGARPCDLGWIRSLVAQARSAGVPMFVKQLGSRPILSTIVEGRLVPVATLPLNDRKGGDPAEWPEDLRVRDYPTIAHSDTSAARDRNSRAGQHRGPR